METVSIQTTQNIEINYKLAGVAYRLWAFFIDAIILFAYGLLASLLLSSFAGLGSGSIVLSLIIGLTIFLYYLLFEIFMDGQTPGKRAAKIRVVKLDGSKPSIGAYLLRWIMIPIDFSLGGGIALVLIIFTKKAQRLGDLLAGTTVVQVKNIDPTLSQSKMVISQIEDDYVPTFPEAIKLGSRDIELIHEAITAFRVHSQRQPVELLKQKMETRLDIQSDLPPIKFLFTLAKDYTYYASA